MVTKRRKTKKRVTLAKAFPKYQTGKQTKTGYIADRRRKPGAKHPGKRTSKSGKVYYERRVNRSDKDRRERV